jgi:hypothetical protein
VLGLRPVGLTRQRRREPEREAGVDDTPTSPPQSPVVSTSKLFGSIAALRPCRIASSQFQWSVEAFPGCVKSGPPAARTSTM